MLPVTEQSFSKCSLTKESLFAFPSDPIFRNKLYDLIWEVSGLILWHVQIFIEKDTKTEQYSLYVVPQQQTLTKSIVMGKNSTALCVPAVLKGLTSCMASVKGTASKI